MTPTDRLVIQSLAGAELDAISTAAAWREIARAAIDRIREQHLELARRDEQIRGLRNELSAFRCDRWEAA
jgi:hypothetical protein